LPDERYVTRFDAEPEFWQYLNGLMPEGLIIELVQNELDARATHTRIAFGADRLISEGDGEPVDDEGWKRLSFVRGAGKDAPRKRRRIGVKNHGLKTCFTIGDEILIQSCGKRSKQTLYRDGPNAAPAPGTFEHPIEDAAAAVTGCRIEVPYRIKPLVTSVGEPLEFRIADKRTIEELFRQACAAIPESFIGVVRPGIRNIYILELEHYRLGTVTFTFRCSTARSIPGGQLFSRVCEVVGTADGLPRSIREGAFCFKARLPAGTNQEIPDFYHAGRGFLAEIAWHINSRGVPISTSGRLRYPIAYSGENLHGRTGIGVHYSGPYISDQERHAASPADFNEYVSGLCDAAVVRLLRDYLVVRYGGGVLRLLLDDVSPAPERVLEMTERLLAERAIPVFDKRRRRFRFGPRRSAQGMVHPVVVPSFTWASQKIQPALQALCPEEFDQVDSKVPEEIVGLLARKSVGEKSLSGWTETRVRFDEVDVLERLQPRTKSAYFPWLDEQTWRRTLGDPNVARTCLDVIVATCEQKPMSLEEVSTLRSNIHFPDTTCVARPLSEMFLRTRLPLALAPLRMPPLLHEHVGAHRLFKKRPWHLKPYTFTDFLELIDFEAETESSRRKLWSWLRKNSASVPRACWPRLAKAPIWPASDGHTYALSQLCLPRDRRIAEVLSRVLRLPTRGVVHFPRLRWGGRSGLVLRAAITAEEVTSFYLQRLKRFPPDRPLSDAETDQFRSFERDLVVLASDTKIASLLSRQPSLTLGRDRILHPPAELHIETPEIAALFLDPSDVIDRSAGPLDTVFPARSRASTEAIIKALRVDAAHTGALISRLAALLDSLRREGQNDVPIASVVCIPHDGSLFAPGDLAFKGTRGDYWGLWKTRLPGTGLSANVQELYRVAGVTSAEPNPHTSLAFFGWLNSQPTSALNDHLEMIIRHLGHEGSVRNWWEAHESVPCIPVEVGHTIRLVSLKEMRRLPNRVFLPDFDELVDSIRSAPANSRLMLAIVQHPRVTKPITDLLRDAGARSLRDAASAALAVRGDGAAPAPVEVIARISELHSNKMVNLSKRLDALDFPVMCLRDHWRNRIDRIRSIKTGHAVTASYRMGGRLYTARVNSGFDEQTGVLWLRQEDGINLTDGLFEALVERMFDHAPKYTASVLERALRREFRDSSPVESMTIDPEPDGNGEQELDSGNDLETGESFQTHHQFQPDPARNTPRPGPIPQLSESETVAVPARSMRTPAKPNPRPPVEIEVLHKADLKQNQYAWHCQVCLASRTPVELAPKGSYVEIAENRQKLIEAHHLDQVHGGGARHAGNLIVLCYRHHHELGNALSRDEITKALVAGAASKSVSFPSGHDRTLQVAGCSVTLTLDSTQQTIEIFFTSAHREHWLLSAGVKSW